jgi:hypothetical protein
VRRGEARGRWLSSDGELGEVLKLWTMSDVRFGVVYNVNERRMGVVLLCD